MDRGIATDAKIVIACDKREAFAQGSEATKQSIFFPAARRIASLRPQRRGKGGCWPARPSLEIRALLALRLACNPPDRHAVEAVRCDRRDVQLTQPLV